MDSSLYLSSTSLPKSYNGLPPNDDNLPVIPDDVQADIRQLLKQYGVERKFCFHLLHNHAELERGTVMLGQKLPEINPVWSRSTPIDKLDLNNIRGHIFVLDAATGSFGPYELREGLPAPMSENDNGFVNAFKDYLVAKNMTRIIGLELLPDTNLVELIFNNNFGTLLMQPEDCTLCEDHPEGRTTAFGAATELKGNVVSHQDRTQSNLPHYMVIDSKRKPWEEEPAYILDVLRQNGAIE